MSLMADTQEKLWEFAISAKHRAYRRLERTLAAQRKELHVLEEDASVRRMETQEVRDLLLECDTDIEGLLQSPDPIPVQCYLDYSMWRQQLEERVKSAQHAQERSIVAVADKRNETLETSRSMARVDNQTRMCKSRLKMVRQKREEALSLQAEEEAVEVIVMHAHLVGQVC